MAKKMRVGLIFGGRSGEHEVSLRSAQAVIEACDKDKYTIVPIAIDKQGAWLAPHQSGKLLPLTSARPITPEAAGGKNKQRADGERIVPDLARQELVVSNLLETGKGEPLALDVVFPVLHGTYGEDGTIQGLLEMANLPYVGCGVLASACGMDKVTMKALFKDAGLPVCKYTWFLRAEWEQNQSALVRRVAREIGYPCFVKPANLGSSVGISRAANRNELKAAISLAARYDRKIIVEEGLDVREIECAVIGNDRPESSLPGEYVVLDRQAAFLDYTEKYSGTGHVAFIVPAKLTKSVTARVRRMAVQAFQSIDGAGLARVDFFLRRDTNELLINELNTMPGLTDVSGFPKMWQASGLEFPQLIDRLIKLALDRHREKSRNETTL
ncbi:MAG: D-alanine--D-alanine ligase family protein [Pyrinomonadaceae bacterium]